MRSVGSHSDRLQNLYFTFLFVLRSVVKASDSLLAYPYNTGSEVDDHMVREGLSLLLLSSYSSSNNGSFDEWIGRQSQLQEQLQELQLRERLL